MKKKNVYIMRAHIYEESHSSHPVKTIMKSNKIYMVSNIIIFPFTKSFFVSQLVYEKERLVAFRTLNYLLLLRPGNFQMEDFLGLINVNAHHVIR